MATWRYEFVAKGPATMRLIGIPILIAIVCTSPISAPAQNDASTSDFSTRFAAANSTHDGCLTRGQALNGRLFGVLQSFDDIDTSKRGCVTLDQIKQFRGKLTRKFNRANTTHDGCLTKQQASDGGLIQVAKNYDKIDTASRGCITLEQVKNFVATEQAQNHQSRGYREQEHGHGSR